MCNNNDLFNKRKKEGINLVQLKKDLELARDKEGVDKLMKNDIALGHRPAQMYQHHQLQTIQGCKMEDRYTMADIADIKAVIKCYVPPTTKEQKYTFNKKGIATFFMCSIDYGSLDINDTLLFIGKDGDPIGIFRSCFKLKRFKEDCLNIEYLEVKNQDSHKNHFGIHLEKEKADSLITKLTKEDLDNLDYILVLKEKNIN